MDFELSDEQTLLQDSVTRLLADCYGDLAQRAVGQRTQAGWSATVWRAFADMGLLGLPFSEADGGSAAGAVETMIVMQAFGQALVIEPYLATVVLGGTALRTAGSPAQRTALIPGVIAGTRLLAFAQQERGARYDLFDIATAARAEGGGFVLDGEKCVVLHGDSADTLIVSARTAGARRDRAGITLFLVDATAAGVHRRGYATQDGMRAADIGFRGVRLGADAVLGTVGDGLAVIERMVDAASVAVGAEAVGAMAALHALTVDYLKLRQQFGVPIGSFQSLQHRAVDMLIELEQARSMAVYAAMMADAPDPATRRAAIAAARVQIGHSARFVGQQAIQLHGGIGMTDEYRAGHYFKRLTMIGQWFGDTGHQLGTLVANGGVPA
jgi:pimeloyl-CoA dehydrogenase small subunit